MKKCKSCQMEIDLKAKKCPHCQTDQRNWFMRHPILTAILILLVIGMIGGASSGGKNTPTQKGDSSELLENKDTQIQPTQVIVQEPIKITAREIADDFDANQVAAENKWRDKFVEFSAQISNITDNGISFYNVASKEFSLAQISCRVEDKNQLLPIKNGQTITVRGYVGSQTIGVIDVSRCQVVQ